MPHPILAWLAAFSILHQKYEYSKKACRKNMVFSAS